jgi:hypothetical protein
MACFISYFDPLRLLPQLARNEADEDRHYPEHLVQQELLGLCIMVGRGDCSEYDIVDDYDSGVLVLFDDIFDEINVQDREVYQLQRQHYLHKVDCEERELQVRLRVLLAERVEGEHCQEEQQRRDV